MNPADSRAFLQRHSKDEVPFKVSDQGEKLTYTFDDFTTPSRTAMALRRCLCEFPECFSAQTCDAKVSHARKANFDPPSKNPSDGTESTSSLGSGSGYPSSSEDLFSAPSTPSPLP